MGTEWLCEVRGLISPHSIGNPSYAGNYRLVYFQDFKALQVKRAGDWVFINRVIPSNIRGVYAAMKYLGV